MAVRESPQSRRWCFTLNNWLMEEYQHIREYPGITYGVIGKEEGDQGTPHLQGFLYFGSNKRLAGVRQVSARAHWEVARGSVESNLVYCSKEGEVEVWGEKPVERTAAGSREASRYADAWTAATEGDLDRIPGDIRFRMYHTVRQIQTDYMAKPHDLPDVCGIWIWGPAGAGKSHHARSLVEADGEEFYAKAANKWWDGYQGQKWVIIDDVDKAHKVLAHHFKLMLDKWAILAEVKGGTLYIRPQHIIITSQYSIDDIWSEEPETRDAMLRRCVEVHLEARNV